MNLLFHFALLVTAIQAFTIPYTLRGNSSTTSRAARPDDDDYVGLVVKIQPDPSFNKSANSNAHRPISTPKSKTSTVKGLIIGGTNAVQKQFPWHCTVIIDESMLCGSSLIAPRILVTAAHCTNEYEFFRVTCGGVNRSAAEPYEITKTTTLKYVHEDYDPTTYNFDISLIKVKTSFIISQYIQPIRPPSISDMYRSFIGEYAIVAGYGKTSSGGSVSRMLNYVKLLILDNEECVPFYGRRVVISSTISTSVAEGTSICQGDSGSGLVMKEPDNVYTLRAISSYVASGGCLQGCNGFTNVAYFQDFIERYTSISFRDYSSWDY